jgi:hypothetical protein
MIDETKLREEQTRARRAHEWLDNPIYKESWEAARLAALAKLEELPLQDAAGREEIHHMLSAMKKVRAYIERAVQDGKLASVELESRKKTLRERLRPVPQRFFG